MCHKDSNCTLCEANCPAKAVKVGAVGTKIEIDWDKCTYCGICINICPTEVFAMREMSRSAFLDTYLQKADKGVLKLSCKEAAEFEGAVFECLGMLGVSEILYFYIHSCKEIIVSFNDCTKCLNKFGAEILKEELSELTMMGSHFEHLKDMQIIFSENRINITFTRSFPAKEFESKSSKKDEPVTRRGMFQLFGRNIADNAVRSAALLSPQEIPSRTPVRLTKEVPSRRELFLDAISSMGKITEPVIQISPYFFSQNIDTEKCTFCMICTRFCPTGALHCGEGGKDKILFTAAECTVCGMCLVSCYHKCIKPSKTINLRELFDETLKAEKKI
jgi:ferredoxin